MKDPHPALLPLRRALQRDPYDNQGSRWTVTQLIDSPQIAVLSKRYAAEIREGKFAADPSENLYRLLGSLAHLLLERSALESEGAAVEERLFDGEISGQIDLRIEKTLVDYKLTSIYSARDPRAKKLRESQLNLLAHLARANGHEAEELYSVLLFRDWRPSEAKRERGYPADRIQIHQVQLWDPTTAQRFLHYRAALFDASEKLPGEKMTPCTDDEMWLNPARWAVKKPSNKRARRLYDSPAEARRNLRAGEQIEHRPADPVRCTGGAAGKPYCPVAKWCKQFEAWKRLNPKSNVGGSDE